MKSETPLSYVRVIDNADTVTPLNICASNKIKHHPCDVLWGARCNAKEQKTSSRLLGTTHCQLTEVPIKGQNEPVFSSRSFNVSDIRRDPGLLSVAE